MPLPNSAVDALGFATLLLVLALLCVGLFCAGYVLHFRSKIHKDNLLALRHFNSLWIVRLILILFAVLWGLGELLRLPLLRKKGWFLHKLGFRWQVNSCKIYILSSLGILEPCFFLTALFLVQGSVRSAPFTPRKRWNGKVLASVLGFCAPVFLVQMFLVVISPAVWGGGKNKSPRNGGGFVDRFKLPHYFTRVFQEMRMEREESVVAACTYPLFSTIALGLFGCVYVIYFLYLGCKMVSLVINRRLQLRVYALLIAVVLLLPVHVLFLGLTVLSRPSEPLFEAVGFLGFLTVLLCTTVGEGILVIRPIADALAIRWRYEEAASVKASALWEPPRSLEEQQRQFVVSLALLDDDPTQAQATAATTTTLDADDVRFLSGSRRETPPPPAAAAAAAAAILAGDEEGILPRSRVETPEVFLHKKFQAAMAKTKSPSPSSSSPPCPNLPGTTLASYTNRILV